MWQENGGAAIALVAIRKLQGIRCSLCNKWKFTRFSEAAEWCFRPRGLPFLCVNHVRPVHDYEMLDFDLAGDRAALAALSNRLAAHD